MKRKPKRRAKPRPGRSGRKPQAETDSLMRLVLIVPPPRGGSPRSKRPRPGEEYPTPSVLFVEGERQYEVDRMLAKGGMGLVYRAKDLACNRDVAMKILHSGRDPQAELPRFIQEAQITSYLEHPNIIPVHEVARDERGNAYYTMKFVRGLTLTEVLTRIRKGDADTVEAFPLARLLTIFQKTCDAVAFAHSRGIVHRDLKPGNVMVGDFGEVLVMDWGLATPIRTRVAEGTSAAVAAATGPRRRAAGAITGRLEAFDSDLKSTGGRVMGTPSFMAPEQLKSGAEIDGRTDIYALGAILYAMLTLRVPVTGKSVRDVLSKILAGSFPPPAFYNQPAGERRKAALAHLPGGEVPAALSDIVMKAMASDPGRRFQTVVELQAEIEAYQNGQVWNLVVDEDFSDPDSVLSRWEPVGGKWEVKKGEFRLYGGEPQFLLLRRNVPGDIRIEFECRVEGRALNDVGCFMSGIFSDNRREIPASGYEFKLGGFDNSLDFLTRAGQRIWSKPDSPLAPGRSYAVRAERTGSKLKLWVNNAEVFRLTDPEPLAGLARTAVGVLGWFVDTRYTRIRVYSMATPLKSDLLDTAERHMLKGHYNTAMDLFEEVIQSGPDPARLAQARRGHESAHRRRDLEQHLPEWREKLARAWPGAPVQVRTENEGLVVDIAAAGIRDLSPLEGMPLTALNCPSNAITSLDPLRGMRLTSLHCSGNPITSLEPVRGMPLSTLLCEYCRIGSLDPIRGSPITMLNCGGSPLQGGLDALKGMPLNWLSVWGCGVRDLSAIRGAPLSALHCDANAIEDLAPLKGMPLVRLNASGNRIERLEPLAGMPLNTIHVGENLVRRLDPLRGMPLSVLSCHFNRIRTLAPLRGMSLGILVCCGNELATLEFLVQTPPPALHFDCDTIPTEELEWLIRTWGRDVRTAVHAKHAQTLAAMRKGDPAQLRALASEFAGHHYLFIPKFMRWDDARAYSESLGGHLVTITSAAENAFVTKLLLAGSWFWMGLRTTGGGQEWVTGEPFAFSAFSDILREHVHGPKIFAGGSWVYDVFPEAHNPFVVEWDD